MLFAVIVNALVDLPALALPSDATIEHDVRALTR